jgi:hypothetical protein
MVFKITSIDYVVRDDDDEERLNQLEADGYRLVKIEREGSQIPLMN